MTTSAKTGIGQTVALRGVNLDTTLTATAGWDWFAQLTPGLQVELREVYCGRNGRIRLQQQSARHCKIWCHGRHNIKCICSIYHMFYENVMKKQKCRIGCCNSCVFGLDFQPNRFPTLSLDPLLSLLFYWVAGLTVL